MQTPAQQKIAWQAAVASRNSTVASNAAAPLLNYGYIGGSANGDIDGNDNSGYIYDGGIF